MQPIHVPSLRVFQGAATVAFNDDPMWDVAGDIKVEVYRSELRAKQLLCYTWLNTSCLGRDMGGQAQVTLHQQDLDKVDEICPRDMALHLYMQVCHLPMAIFCGSVIVLVSYEQCFGKRLLVAAYGTRM